MRVEELPEGWELRPLNKLIKFTYGFAFDSSKFNKDKQGAPLIRIRNLIQGKTDTFFKGEYDPFYLVKKNNILIGMDGEFNIVKWKG